MDDDIILETSAKQTTSCQLSVVVKFVLLKPFLYHKQSIYHWI